MDLNEAPDKSDKGNARQPLANNNQPSLPSLILWNVSKAVEKNPQIDLRSAMKSANDRMEHQLHDVNDLVSQYPEQRHIACAVLAWQQLGHKDTESLYAFIESHRNKELRNTSESSSRKENVYSVNSLATSKRPKGFIDHKPCTYSNSDDSTSFDTCSLIGPVVKLPVETKVVMRVENTAPCARHGAKKSPTSDIKNKLDVACCLDTACVEKLRDMEKSTAELRSRAMRLARREAERAELLERAEAAWRDLELGYQRRLLIAEEKEEDIAKQIKKSIEDRNAYKHACTVLAQQLSKRGEIVENDHKQLTQLEKELCELACTRLQQSEESAKGDAAIADQQCKTVQLERDLQFKEEQARRKLLSIESAMESSRGLTLEAERAMREELGMIKEQMAQVSTQLLEWDAENNQLNTELEELRKQKTEMFEDLDSCKQICDNRMQGNVDELNKKRQLLNEMKETVIDCQCKLPVDAAVEVKRTPSLAALCRCTAEDHILNSCSCTSVRSTLLSNLLSDLFGGLQAEMGDTGSRMPCQLLKCLEDKHNWDRASVVKTNLRSFFSHLLVGELDTAIATSIEKYHATWVGVSCADKSKIIPEPGEVESEDWQERALERRAQKLAGQLAEQLFQERADQLVQRAKDIVTSGPPPCECRPQSNKTAAYPCLVKPLSIGNSGKRNDPGYPTYVKGTLRDVTSLRTQIENLKKESIKKEDLRIMEEKITKLVQQASGPNNIEITTNISKEDDRVKQKSIHRIVNTEDLTEVNECQSSIAKKKKINYGTIKRSNKKPADVNGRPFNNKVTGKTIKKIDQTYAVNICLLDGQKKPNDKPQKVTCSDDLNILKENKSQNLICEIASIKQSKIKDKAHSKDDHAIKNKKKSGNTPCSCFHRVPSNTSIDQLLETLLKWNSDIGNYSLFNMAPIDLVKTNSNIKEIHHDSELSNNKISLNMTDVKETSLQIVTQSVKGTEIDYLPPLTTSEYIGEINLDKSNEHICKCQIKSDEENKLNNENKSSSNANLLFKCLNTSECTCKKSKYMKQNRNVEKTKGSIQSLDENFNNRALTNIKELHDESYILEGVKLNTLDHKSIPCLSHKNNQTSESNFLPNDKDALVRFLGVTLTDIKDSKAINEGRANKNLDKSLLNTSMLKHRQQDFYSKATSLVKSDNQKQSSAVYNVDVGTEPHSKSNVCQYMKVYSNLDNTTTEGKNHYSEEKNNQCLGEVLCNRKSCVCCNYDDEAKNLEVNTFCLLEKHLKQKLAEYKISSGKPSCVLPQDEEKVFITLLDKVKQVISNCTYNIKCDCSPESRNNGSWVRFNNLLEEYLKIKIKRAKCACFPNKDSVETILPGVLEQVSNLIANDFERLKNLCKCKKNNNFEKENTMNDNRKGQVMIENKEIQHIQPEKMFTILENVSIQGSDNLEVENKSCNAIKMKDTKDIQTSHNKLLLESHSVEAVGDFCNIHDGLALKNLALDNYEGSKSQNRCEEHLSTTQVESCTSQKSKKTDKNNSLCSLRAPYIGFTLSCSCDKKLGSCICSKSLSQSCVKNFNTIRQMIDINKKLLPNLSYIMDSIPKRARSQDQIINFVDVAEDSFVPLIQEQHKNLSASDGEEIILKDSAEKLNPRNVNHNITSTEDDLVTVKRDCLNDDDALYWYDCSTSSYIAKDDIIHKKSLYDSIYSPIGKLPKQGNSETSIKNNVTKCVSKSKNCDCVMVPVCHVKMLVENIENKLINSQCTCDSLCAKVCPFHSKTKQ